MVKFTYLIVLALASSSFLASGQQAKEEALITVVQEAPMTVIEAAPTPLAKLQEKINALGEKIENLQSGGAGENNQDAIAAAVKALQEVMQEAKELYAEKKNSMGGKTLEELLTKDLDKLEEKINSLNEKIKSLKRAAASDSNKDAIAAAVKALQEAKELYAAKVAENVAAAMAEFKAAEAEPIADVKAAVEEATKRRSDPAIARDKPVREKRVRDDEPLREGAPRSERGRMGGGGGARGGGARGGGAARARVEARMEARTAGEETARGRVEARMEARMAGGGAREGRPRMGGGGEARVAGGGGAGTRGAQMEGGLGGAARSPREPRIRGMEKRREERPDV